jgi:hypothetical protein
MYSQPGKHAMLSDERLMNLYTRLYNSCDRLAGIGGLDAPEKYLSDIHITPEENAKVAEYIKKKYSFVPSLEFEESLISSEYYIPWDELEKEIPIFIKKQLEIILQESIDGD